MPGMEAAPLSRPHRRHRSEGVIAIRGARQNNLKGLDLDLPLREFIVVTGVSGSGKSSLAFDTVYAEGQRRYVETFSPYARQFLDRMDRPRADRIDGIPPAVAVDQTNQVRTSRSTVGTMTEINDYLKLLYARLARLHCRGCGEEVRRDTPESIADRLLDGAAGERASVRFRVRAPDGFPEDEVRQHLARQGYTRVERADPEPGAGARPGTGIGTDSRPEAEAEAEAGTGTGTDPGPAPVELVVVQDRLRLRSGDRGRLVEALEAALAAGRGRAEVVAGEAGAARRFSANLECPRCEIAYRDPIPNLFSFNSPIGACETCRGFGREMGIDYGLVIPDENRTLRGGAVKPLQTKTYLPYQRYLLKQAERAGVPVDTPWRDLSPEDRAWVIEGDGRRREDRWFGLHGFFDWLERKSYRMHIRVLLSRYRGYLRCTGCGGGRLKPEALDWRLAAAGSEVAAARPESLNVHEFCSLPLDRCLAFLAGFRPPAPFDEAAGLLLDEIRSRLRYLVDVGLGYLTLDRQSRTLSGGEVQRINLTTALGTSLVNTLFVLDEPSVGLHPRDLGRMIGVLHRLRDAGNTILVVEHDAQVIRAADRVLDLGPGPGAAGGEVVYEGTPRGLLRSAQSLTGAYLAGRLQVAPAPGPRAASGFEAPAPPTGGEAAVPDEAALPGELHTSAGTGWKPGGHPVPDAGANEGEGGGSALAEGRREANGRKCRQRGEWQDRDEAAAETRAGGGDPGPGKSAGAAASPSGPARLLVRGAAEHNLKGIDVRIPLGRLVCLTGVSGSGKSTLLEDVCHRGLLKWLGRPRGTPGRHDGIDGAEAIGDVVMVDQSPIGKTSRSVPASYAGALDPIRRLFAAEPLARERGHTAGRFSFNHADGRCPTCSGNGFEHLEMQFLSDVYLRCPDCDGRRYRTDVLEVKLAPDGLSIADVLDLTVDEAIVRFADSPEVCKGLAPLRAVGLGYVTLGQAVPTLSGGEAQRLKLAGHLAGAHRGEAGRRGGAARRNPDAGTGRGTLFLFDEPTTGLHFRDVAVLLAAFRELIAAGHSVVVIEHHLDVIAAADWIIDLGPEGGDAGGEIVCEGPPAAVAADPHSHTGRELRAHHRQRDGTGDAAPAPPKDAAACPPAYRTGAGFPRVDGGDSGLGGGRFEPPAVREPAGRYGPDEAIEVRRARDHNLKDVDVRLPRGRFTAVTGVSGSGKSTLAFDVVFAEGQRRYLESLNAYARQFVQPAARPDVDAVLGIPPTVAIEQRTSRGGNRSTVATATEVHHFLRLLFAKLGVQHCPDCDRAIESRTRDAIVADVIREFRGRTVDLLAPLVAARKGYYTDLARWAARKGYPHLRVDGERLPTGDWPRLDRYREHDVDLPIAALTVEPAGERALRTALDTALELGRSVVIVAERQRTGTGKERRYSTARACAGCGRSFDEPDPRLFSFNSRHGWCPRCQGTGREPAPVSALDSDSDGRTGRRRRKRPKDRRPSEPRTAADYEREALPAGVADTAADASAAACGACGGDRLRPEARAVRFRERTIGDLGRLSITEARGWAAELVLGGREAEIAGDLLAELRSRLDFLLQTGLGYLSLHRSAPSLSGGEAQRIRLASQLGSNLRGVCYVLDEPTIGLHPRDNSLLLDALDRLRAHGNTVVVVEHDEATIRRAEHVIDLGPGAGAGGGEVVAAGSLAKLMRTRRSVTGRWLARPPPPMKSENPVRLSGGDGQTWIEVRNARRHNLKGIHPRFPLGRLVCVTGVSGSGKSTLVREVLRESLEAALDGRARGNGRGTHGGTADGHASGNRRPARRPARSAAGGTAGKLDPPECRGDAGSSRTAIEAAGCDALLGAEPVTRVLEVDQTPIGKTPRSCPVTYLKIWDHVRRLFAETTEARLRGWSASRFSFNTSERAGGGRCPACGGQGERKIEMSFLPNARVPCDECEGARFTRETLEVRFRARNVGEILDMTVDEAVEFFAAHPPVHHALRMLQEVGLGYLRLGQRSPTLSGGEAQRLKLVTELAKARPADSPRARRNHTVYLLDEPTVGLHMADVEKLVRVLHRLAAAGHTVIVIEHNLDVIAAADWIVDLGPEGGDGGGQVVAEGAPDQVAGLPPLGHTGRALADFLRDRAAA